MDRSNFPYLNDHQWEIFTMMADHVGEAAIMAIASMQPPNLTQAIEHYGNNNQVLFNKAQSEVLQVKDNELKSQLEAQHHQHEADIAELKNTFEQRFKAEKDKISVATVKLNVAPYKGHEGENLERWKLKINVALFGNRIKDPQMQVAFAMSHLASRAEDWAYGKLMTDPQSFPDVITLFKLLERTFHPPKNEFRLREQFLDLKQGKLTLHDYIQRTRQLVAAIVDEPISEKMKITRFLKGLNQGPVRTYLYRLDLKTLEDAFNVSLDEEFSFKASLNVDNSRQQNMHKHNTSRMDLSTFQGKSTSSNNKKWNKNNSNKPTGSFDKSKITCRRCLKLGHYASECRASAPVTKRYNSHVAVASVESQNTRKTGEQLNVTSQ